MSYLAQEGATAFELKAQGGHKDIKSMERYAHLNSQLSKSAAKKNAQEDIRKWLNGAILAFSENPKNRDPLVLLVWQGSSVG